MAVGVTAPQPHGNFVVGQAGVPPVQIDRGDVVADDQGEILGTTPHHTLARWLQFCVDLVHAAIVTGATDK